MQKQSTQHNTTVTGAAPKAAGTSFRDSLKSMDTEEHIDLWFYRPIGYAWARLAARIGVTPNAITIASIFLGIGAGVAFYFSELWVNIIGMVLLVWANSFDSADGQLARMTGQYSRIGRILDGMAGDVWFATIYVAICLREIHTSQFFIEHHWAIWTLAVATGICHAKQASMADYYRQFHLFFLKGKDGAELENIDDLRRKYKNIPWKGNFWEKLTILHKIANFPEGKPLPARYARHLYDVYNMGNSWVKESAFKRKELLEKDIAFKQKFYYAKGAHYETATLSSIELLPRKTILNALQEDYQAMKNMIYGNIPEFEEILAFLKELQEEIHRLE